MADELPPPAPRLPVEVLARRDALPRKPAEVLLTGTLVVVEPLDLDDDVDGLYAVSNGEAFALGDRTVDEYDPEALVWRYMSGGPFASAGALRAWLVHQDEALDGRPFVVRDKVTGTPVG